MDSIFFSIAVFLLGSRIKKGQFMINGTLLQVVAAAFRLDFGKYGFLLLLLLLILYPFISAFGRMRASIGIQFRGYRGMKYL